MEDYGLQIRSRLDSSDEACWGQHSVIFSNANLALGPVTN